jgi:PAS domain S-box-containing protein
MAFNTNSNFINIVFNVIDHTNAMLAYWDKNLICRFANNAYSKWFEKTPDEMIDKMYLWELGSLLYQRNLKQINAVLKGELQVFDRLLTTPSGEIKNTRATYTPNFIDGEIDGFFVHVADISPIDMKTLMNDQDDLKTEKVFLFSNDQILEQVVQTLKSCIFTEFPSIATLSKKHFISESKLKRDFKEKYNSTIFSYFRNLQMEFAEKCLNEKRCNKSQMALMLNFSNPSNFSSCYQKYLNEKLAKELINKIHSENQENHKTFIEQAPVAIAMFDNNMVFIEASLKWIEDYNLQGKEIIGVHLYKVLPQIKSQFHDLLLTCLKGESHFDDAIIENQDGSLAWMHWDLRPWYKDRSEIGGFLILTENITPFKLKEAESRQVLEILNKTQKIARIGAWSRNFVKNTTIWSKVLKEMLEVPEDFSPDLDTAMGFYKEGANRNLARLGLKDALENGKSFDGEFEMITAKKNSIRVRAVCYPEFNNGICEKLSGIFIDITHQTKHPVT